MKSTGRHENALTAECSTHDDRAQSGDFARGVKTLEDGEAARLDFRGARRRLRLRARHGGCPARATSPAGAATRYHTLCVLPDCLTSCSYIDAQQ